MARTISSIITKSKGQLLLNILFGCEQQSAISGCSHLPEPAVVLIGPVGVLPEPLPQGKRKRRGGRRRTQCSAQLDSCSLDHQ